MQEPETSARKMEELCMPLYMPAPKVETGGRSLMQGFILPIGYKSGLKRSAVRVSKVEERVEELTRLV